MAEQPVWYRSSGSGREQLSPDELRHYQQRASASAPQDMLTWLHHEQL